MDSLSTTEMPRLDKVIQLSGGRINSKSHGYKHRKHTEKNTQCDGGRVRVRRGLSILFYVNPGIPLYFYLYVWETLFLLLVFKTSVF